MVMATQPLTKPLGGKAYGSIPHLPGSRLGTGDHHCHAGQGRICVEQVRDRHDEVIVQEKLDGSCCSVARIGDQIVALGRAGWTAQSSPYEQHQLFAAWVRAHEWRFRDLLRDGERVVGEWLAQAHGTRYELWHEPFVAFDIIVGLSDPKRGLNRLPYDDVERRCQALRITTPTVLHRGGPLSIDAALAKLDPRWHGALDQIEGAVWRVQRRGVVDFLAKYVRPDKVDGCYLPEMTQQPPIWNWRPRPNFTL